MIRRLVVSHGQRERELALVGTLVVGRDPECDVSEDADSLLSRRHSEFALGPDGVVVRDLGSRNGTFINGVKTVESPVKPGDVVQIGHLVVRLVEGEAPLPAWTAPPAEGADDDATRMMRAPAPPAAAAAPTGAQADDDRTMIVPRAVAIGGSPAAARAASTPAGVATAANDDRTLIVRPAAAASRPAAPAQAPASARASTSLAAPAANARQDRAPSAAGHVTLLSAVAFLSGASALLIGNDAGASPLVRLLPGVVVAAIATLASAASINRRLARAASIGDRISNTSRLGGGTQASAGAEAGR